MGIGVLGPLTVDGSPARLAHRDRVVLSALVVAGDEALSLDRLAEAVWGDRPPASWRKVLHGCVTRLRRTLRPAAIATVPNGYRLTVGPDDVDARTFERMVRRAAEVLALGEPDRALFVLGEASALWRGRALSDLDGWEPGRIEARRLDEMRLDGEELRIEAALRAGRHLEVLAEAQAGVAEAPLRERRWTLLALAQYQAGRQAEALTSLRRARTVLRTELGLEPGPDLASVERAILRHDPSLSTAQRQPEPSAGCPYRGLLPYDVSDAEAFFGRDADVEACLRRLATGRVLVVVGPSGSGKSSLVRAGVVATLRRQGRPAVVVTPGHHPVESLAAAPASGRHRLLVVDQCEEAFTQCEDPGERARFLSQLADRAERADPTDGADGSPLVVVIRADRIGELSAEPRLARAVERGLYLLGPMRELDLRAAVEGPAGQAGLLIEPGLVDLVVRDAEGEPGALPLLSHALRQTWQRREGRTLTVTGYRATGGIRGAVANTADELHDGLPVEQRPMLRGLLLRLVVEAPGGEPSRARVPRRLVAVGPEQDSMIERLVAARLVTADEGFVELAHEALARAWPRLRSWLEEDADGQRIHRHLSAAADAWGVMDRPDSEVYRGARLARALEWQERSQPDLTATEEAFLDAARSLAAADEMRAAEQARHQERANRRLRALLAAAVAMLLVAGVAGAVAARQARLATAAATAADARRVGAQAVVAPQLDNALLLAVAGVRLDGATETRRNLLATLNRAAQLIRVVPTSGHTPRRLQVSTDGRTLVVLDGQLIGTYETASLRGAWGREDPRVPFPAGESAIRPDGGQAAILSTVGLGQWSFRLVSAAGKYDGPQLLPKADQAGGIDYSPDGRLLAIGHDNELHDRLRWTGVQIWDLSSASGEPVLVPLPFLPQTVRFSPDGRLLYVGAPLAGRVRRGVESFEVVDARSHVRRGGFELSGRLLDISPDGRLLAVAEAPPEGEPGGAAPTRMGDVLLVDARTRAERLRLPGDDLGPATRIRFSRDGRSLAAVAAGGTVTVWSLPSGELTEELRGHAGGVLDIAFDRVGATLYTAGEEGTILVWDLRGDRRFVRRTATMDRAYLRGSDVLIAPDGRSAALNRLETGPDGRVRGLLGVADLDTGGRITWVDTRHGQFHGPAWRPDGGRFATTGADGIVRIWDPAVAVPLAWQQISHADVAGVAYAPDGRRLVVGDNRALQLDAETLATAGSMPLRGNPATRLAVSPDNRTVVVLGTRRDAVVLVDLPDSRTREIPTTFVPVDAAFSPDARRLAVAGQGGEVLLLDVGTGGRARFAPTGHDGAAGRVRFSPDGRRIVSGGRDGRAVVWDGHTGEILGAAVVAPPGSATFPAFLADGHSVVAVATDGTVHTWDSDPQSWLAAACRIAGRDLTSTEWAQSFPDRPHQSVCTG